MSHEGSLEAQGVARILRRASELELSDSEGDSDRGIAEASWIEAAEEVGMSVTAVRSSIALERLGPVPAPRMGDRIVGGGAALAPGEGETGGGGGVGGVRWW